MSRQRARQATLFAMMREAGHEPGTLSGWSEQELDENYRILCGSGTSMSNLPLACCAAEYLSANHPDTVRGVMYQMVSNTPFLADTSDPSYNRVQRLLSRLRENGTIPFEWIVDNVRRTIKPSSWSGLHDYVETVRDCYRLDFWSRLPAYVEIIVEKDTVAGKLAPVTQEFDVPLHPLRGYSSSSFAWQISQAWREIIKPITVYYTGDFDPSGLQMEEDIRDKLRRYSGQNFAWRRLAVLAEHFEVYGITPLPIKSGDKRKRWFTDRYGHDCAEVEAIPATDLRSIVRKAIESHIPPGAWERLRAVEQAELESWQQSLGQFVV